MINPSILPTIDPQVAGSMHGVLERLQKDTPLAAFQENILQVQFDNSISLTNKILFYSIVNNHIQNQFIGLPITELETDKVKDISELEENISIVIGLKLVLLENVLQLYLQANEENFKSVDMLVSELISEVIQHGTLQSKSSIVATKLFAQIQRSVSDIDKLTPKFASLLVQLGALFVQEFLGLSTGKRDDYRLENTSKLVDIINVKADAFERIYIYQSVLKFLNETATLLALLLKSHDLTQSLDSLAKNATIPERIERMAVSFATTNDPYSEPAALLMDDAYKYLTTLTEMLKPIQPDDTDQNSTAGTIGW